MIDSLPWLNVDFGHMTVPALVVYGDRDQSILTTRGPDWAGDPYYHAPAPKSLLTLPGLEHSLGGAVGYDSLETTDRDPAAVSVLQRLTTAYLRTALGLDPDAWPGAVDGLAAEGGSAGAVESK